jgi:hypothetical protein
VQYATCAPGAKLDSDYSLAVHWMKNCDCSTRTETPSPSLTLLAVGKVPGAVANGASPRPLIWTGSREITLARVLDGEDTSLVGCEPPSLLIEVVVMQLWSRDHNTMGLTLIQLSKKRSMWGTAQLRGLPAAPDLLRQVGLKLGLRNCFPGPLRLRSSAIRLRVAVRRRLQHRAAWRGEP